MVEERPVGVVVTTWAEDCILRGSVAETGARLSDEVNGSGHLELSAVTVEALDDGRVFDLESVLLGIDDMCILELGGDRGHPERRIGTVRHRVVAEIGPYLVAGDFHTLRGVKPLTAFRHRAAIVPLTAAVVELSGTDGLRRWECETIGLNQHRIVVIRDAEEEEPEQDLVPV
jgi:hypothetical protein